MKRHRSPKDEIIRRLRLGDLRKVIGDRCRHNGGILPEDDAGIEYLRELLLPISIGPYEARMRPGAIGVWGPNDRMRQEICRWAPWMDDNRAGALIDEINQMPLPQRKPKARTLGDRLSVTYKQREELQLRTIAPCDVSDAAMALIRKRKRRKRDKERRQLQSRSDYLATHRKSKEKPWLQLGMSRPKYYRLQLHRETSPHPINLLQSSSRPVSPEKRLVSKEEVAEQEPSALKSAATPQSQKPEMPVIDSQPELMTQTCLTPEQISNGDLRGMPADMSALYPRIPSYEELMASLNTKDVMAA
jgi:hypothetical protein